jgi:catechol 2,3-dioxygenase-like lactoylglutathione lyase family enzyme
LVTLAVSDLERALDFYRKALGLDSPGVTGTEFTGDETNAAGAVVVFRLEGGTVLALYPGASSPKTRKSRRGRPAAASSASATSSQPAPTSMRSLSALKPPARS